MALVPDIGGDDTGNIGGGGIGHASYTFRQGESTVYAFSPEDIENAVRNEYTADESGIPYALVFVRPELIQPSAFDDVASSYAWIWNENAKVPGVTDIAPDQQITQLGRLVETVQVAITSTSGRSDLIITLDDQHIMPDAFAAAVRAQVARLDAIEGNG